MIRIVLFIVVIYVIYSVYNSLRKPTGKKVTKQATTCPSPKVFIDYTEGRIKGKQKKAIDRHIARCKNCQDALRDVFDISKKEALK